MGTGSRELKREGQLGARVRKMKGKQTQVLRAETRGREEKRER